MFSQYPLALDNLKYIDKTNVSSVTSLFPSSARPFSEHKAAKPRGRNSRCLMGDEREGPPRGQKGTRSKSYKCCPCKCPGAGQPDTRHGRSLPPQPPGSYPAVVRESLSLLGFILFTGDSLPTEILFLFYKKSAWSSGEEKLCGGEAKNT